MSTLGNTGHTIEDFAVGDAVQIVWTDIMSHHNLKAEVVGLNLAEKRVELTTEHKAWTRYEPHLLKNLTREIEPRAPERRYGLYWSPQGDLYAIHLVLPADVRNTPPAGQEVCRVANLSSPSNTGITGLQECRACLDYPLEHGLLKPCTPEDLKKGFGWIAWENRA